MRIEDAQNDGPAFEWRSFDWLGTNWEEAQGKI